ncbi:MAG: hypothetical protein H0V53_07965 [Rubrobacter sp.]|nr:hypothetical protein [Rubrobacter sp.]
MRERVDDALLKEMLGHPLSERELMIVQWVRNGGGCAPCRAAEPDRVQDRRAFRPGR